MRVLCRKIFNIGMPRSGTRSFADALRMLGLKCLHNPQPFRNRNRKLDMWDRPGEWDAMSNCCEWGFSLLLEHYPDAQYVCTFRTDSDRWAESAAEMLLLKPNHKNNPSICGHLISPELLRRQHPSITKRIKHLHRFHLAAVKDWSEQLGISVLFHRPQDGWKPLCKHLGKEVPGGLYPHSGKSLEKANQLLTPHLKDTGTNTFFSWCHTRVNNLIKKETP